MEKKILIIIDAQHDFCDKNGALYVPNAEIAIDNIISFINKNKEMIEQVVFTTDNHPADHCSFKKNGGIWPEHCVQHTYGQALMLPLLECCDDNDLPINVINKGERKDEEEYTAFSCSEKVGDVITLKSSTDSLTVYNDKFIVCGFAGDYCVKDSIADLIPVVGAENIEIFREGVADIDDGTIFNKFIEENGLNVLGEEKVYSRTELGLPEKVYMIADVNAFRGKVLTVKFNDSVDYSKRFNKPSGKYIETYNCSFGTDDDFRCYGDVSDFMKKKHERKNGVEHGRYRYFSNEQDARQYMLEHGWCGLFNNY